MTKKGLTLLEILISAMIMALVISSLANIFITSKRHIRLSRSKIQTAELGRLFLAPLQMQVRQDNWDQPSNILYLLPGQEDRSWSGSAENLDNIDYTPNYTVSRVRDLGGNDTGLRRLEITITWNEP